MGETRYFKFGTCVDHCNIQYAINHPQVYGPNRIMFCKSLGPILTVDRVKAPTSNLVYRLNLASTSLGIIEELGAIT